MRSMDYFCCPFYLSIYGLGDLMRGGIREWAWQHVSAVYLLGYIGFLGIFFAQHYPLTYNDWSWLWASMGMQVATVLALLFLGLHAVIGLSIVLMDYVKCKWARSLLQCAGLFSLLAYVGWGILNLWGN